MCLIDDESYEEYVQYFFGGVVLLDTFGARVRYLRRLWGLRQADIYKSGGPSRSTLSRIENGEEGPGDVSESTLQGLALSLKCTRSWLETGAGRVWLEGVVPPQGAAEDALLRLGSGKESIPQVNARPDPELGKYITEGIMDWRILEHTVNVVMTIFHEAGGYSQDHNLNFAEAYQLVYRYLSKQTDPFDPIHHQAALHLITVVWG